MCRTSVKAGIISSWSSTSRLLVVPMISSRLPFKTINNSFFALGLGRLWRFILYFYEKNVHKLILFMILCVYGCSVEVTTSQRKTQQMIFGAMKDPRHKGPTQQGPTPQRIKVAENQHQSPINGLRTNKELTQHRYIAGCQRYEVPTPQTTNARFKNFFFLYSYHKELHN